MRHALSTLLKSWLACTALVFAGLALALPTPKDIELAVSQGQLTQAESMLREVIAAKPQSAKAQYELGQVLLRQNRLPEAQAALQQARSLDPSLKFASSDKQFQDLMDRTQAKAKPAPAQTAAAATAPAAPPATESPSTGFSWGPVWMGIAAIGLLAVLMRLNRPKARPSTGTSSPGSVIPAPSALTPQTMAPTPANPQALAPAASAALSPLSTAFGRNPAPGYAGAPAGYAAASPPAAAPSGGSNIGGAVLGGLAGVAAGYALSKVLEGEKPAPAQSPAAESSPPPSGNTWADNQGLVGAGPSGAVPDFDPGTGSGWDSPSDELDFGADDSW